MKSRAEVIQSSTLWAALTIFVMLTQLLIFPALAVVTMYFMAIEPTYQFQWWLLLLSAVWFTPKTRKALWLIALELYTAHRALTSRQEQLCIASSYFGGSGVVIPLTRVNFRNVESIKPISCVHAPSCFAVFLRSPNSATIRRSGLAGFALRMNKAILGTPVVICASALKVSTVDLEEILNTALTLDRTAPDPNADPMKEYLLPYVDRHGGSWDSPRANSADQCGNHE